MTDPLLFVEIALSRLRQAFRADTAWFIRLFLAQQGGKLGATMAQLPSADLPGRSQPPGRDAPATLGELRQRAESIAGLSLGQLADQYDLKVPEDLRRNKGWVGLLLERHLGATARSRAEPDFPHLGVELKSLPVDQAGKPLESTFVCTIELTQLADCEWENSRLMKKLRHVLWVPVEAQRDVALAVRRIGTPIFWQPSSEDVSQLRADWEGLSLLIAQGRTGEITAHLGQVLQVRPKAAKGGSRRRALDDEGALYDEQPKGFYLRTSFTAGIIQRSLRIG